MEPTITSISDIISLIQLCLAFIWDVFDDFISIVTDNPVIFFMVIFAILAGIVSLVVAIIRKFGLKGRRR